MEASETISLCRRVFPQLATKVWANVDHHVQLICSGTYRLASVLINTEQPAIACAVGW